MPNTHQDDVQATEHDRYGEPIPRLHWNEHPERRVLKPGDETAVVLIGVVDGERLALNIGGEVAWGATAEDAGGLLDNYARPDGPLQHEMFGAVGLRGLNDDGEALWEELHYTEERPVKHLA